MPRAKKPNAELLWAEVRTLFDDLGKVELERQRLGLTNVNQRVTAINLTFINIRVNSIRIAMEQAGLLQPGAVALATINHLKEVIAAKAKEISDLEATVNQSSEVE